MAGPAWFRAKRYGWGWTPATWQGWAVTAVYALAVLGWAAYLLIHRGVLRNWQDGSAVLIGVAPVLVLSAAVVAICWIKGERPGWHWGK